MAPEARSGTDRNIFQPLLDRIRQTPQYVQLLDRAYRGEYPAGGLGLPRAARLPLVAALASDLSRPSILVTDRADRAAVLQAELSMWTDWPVVTLPEPSPLFYENSEWGKTTQLGRVRTLAELAAFHLPAGRSLTRRPIVVSSIRALMIRTIPLTQFLESCRVLSPGTAIAPTALQHRLQGAGFARTRMVVGPGEFAVRGGLLDVWPPALDQPVRLDFFGDEIESLKSFDAASQRTIGDLEWLLLTPAREHLQPSSEILAGEISPLAAESLSAPDLPTDASATLLHPDASSALGFLPPSSLTFVDDWSLLAATTEEVERQAVEARRAAVADGSLPSDAPIPYVTWSELRDDLEVAGAVELGSSSEDMANDGTPIDFASLFRHDVRFGGRLKPFIEHAQSLATQGEQLIIVSRQTTRLKELWGETSSSTPELLNEGSHESSDEPAVSYADGSLSEGFVIQNLHLITDSEIFGWERPPARALPRKYSETPESFYADLRAGDYVVHIDHGIGRFVGLLHRNLDGADREFLGVEYEGGGQLFVPVHQADRLTRYIAQEGAEPALDRLGGHDWREKKGRAREAVLEVAQEMLGLHAKREVVSGHAFGSDTAWQHDLEVSFPYIETEDQLRALAEIKRDMEARRPMDRLLCGDVGYGKTELALRAAFKAVMDGKQVAILVPTTVLAQQHFETFLERLAPFPVRIEMLSRFRSARQQAEIVRALSMGEIDIVVGTHRLLSPDIGFKDLGLVVIDEEQRFGVTHKERLKELRTEVDVLTLTATPIPRTLYMALTGVRDISNLNTPPEERLPIVTHIGPYSPQLTRRAIIRELERGGQVFFVHNRVNTIEAMRTHLQQLVPQARVDVGHGQMEESRLADVMHRFNRGQTDILLSTTIIESGLDIPNANTLIVDRADTFGLSQLYQLRGRVGRGAARAYAYFFRHRKLPPTREGQQRLEVIAENSELGSGYSIAMRDLEIRGAGELLGTRQHGHIQAIGFHLYTRLLSDAVRQIRREGAAESQGGKEAAFNSGAASIVLSQPVAMPVNVDLPIEVGIPAAYIRNDDLRLGLYRRIADIRDEAELDALTDEFQDRFGSLPPAVQNLFVQMRMKLRAERAGLASIAWEGGQVVLRYPPSSNGRAVERLPDLGPGIRGGKGAYWCTFPPGQDWISGLLGLLEHISSI